MTLPIQERTEDSTDRTSGDHPSVGRRPLLKALSTGAALSAVSGVATADVGTGDGGQPEGFETEVVAPHSSFTDDVAAAFGIAYEDGAKELAFLRDVSTIVIVRGSFEPGGTSGWHTDNGPALAVVVEGEVDVTYEEGCATRTYVSGEAALITGRGADLLENASDTEEATLYVIFLGVPDGEPPSAPVEAPNC